MYNFMDTVATGSNPNTLLSLNTIFNNVNLDEALTDNFGRFVTTSVGGRGVMSKRINLSETPYQHGARESDYTYPPREIPVTFLLEASSNEVLRERFNYLNSLLRGSQKRLEFTDEKAYFVATLQSGDTPPENSNSMEGTLLFLCTDPLKRKQEHEIQVGTNFDTFTIHGLEKTPWKLVTQFNTTAEQFILENNQDGKIILNYSFIDGDILEIDYKKRRVTLNGENLAVALSFDSQWFELKPGPLQLRASHGTTVTYIERYY